MTARTRSASPGRFLEFAWSCFFTISLGFAILGFAISLGFAILGFTISLGFESSPSSIFSSFPLIFFLRTLTKWFNYRHDKLVGSHKRDLSEDVERWVRIDEHHSLETRLLGSSTEECFEVAPLSDQGCRVGKKPGP